ncbi:SMP-30/gluconolactonase/LRE family protein [Tropicibacter oceani]|uniref:SMP-30/gluconolactonase/LRE family protein n=1 Tax=Tropicibacter oceani TaxID=3058420 RepID=A0ABY8QHU0_9RHOB|nr:SMP-30/gluconolactonase/LRE family protein [Tropicibacter oceani]WGW03548.1 SMP-30/gluconolactonase/LRE family protein [Tropicibacter oceani]
MTTTALSDTICELGEGPLWHPERETFFWFDIMGRKLFEHDGAAQRHWDFDREVSAAGWVDRGRLLVATARDLILFDLETGQESHVVDLEADNPLTRSNDGRADPQGGFWIGTMGYQAQPGAGAIYRFYRGELRQLYPGITIPNAICFAPDGRQAYFTDTADKVIRRVALDGDGWPAGDPVDWLDLGPEGINPDGAVVDADGNFWNAQWGAGRVACYDPQGRLEMALRLPATQTTCPAFGGPGLMRLLVTSAAGGAPADDKGAGKTYVIDTLARGQQEHRVIL